MEHDVYQTLKSCEEKVVIKIYKITKKHNPDFRFHKNGSYIGRHKISYEHLGDETIDSIWSFGIYVLKE